MMSGINKYSDYYQIDNPIDFGEKRKISSEVNCTREEVCSIIHFINISCSFLKVIVLS